MPAACAVVVDQTTCPEAGDVVRFTPEFGAATPSGAGAEVVLDRSGCVVRTAPARGTTLAAGEVSLQATGRATVALLATTASGCLRQTVTLSGGNGRRVPLRPGLYGVDGRYRLTRPRPARLGQPRRRRLDHDVRPR